MAHAHGSKAPWRAALTVALPLAASAGVAQTPAAEHLIAASKSFPATPTRIPPAIDGVLDDATWRELEPIRDFHQIEPVEYAEPTQLTEVWLTYDTAFIYIAAQLHDERPDLIVARQLVQGRPYGSDDRFAVRLDTFHDHRNAFVFRLNPNGIRGDALAGNDYHIEEWDGIWEGEARVNERGWAIEIAVPYKTLSFDPDTDVWGINFWRAVARTGERMAWSSRERSIAPAYSGDVNGLAGMEQGLGLDVAPSAVLHHSQDHVNGARRATLEPSLDAFYKVGRGLTAALTLNTDFSATEVDDRQVNLSRFSLFFPEKRDFFLQDAAIFRFSNLDVNGRPFFSRTIGLSDTGEPVDINAGGKLAGRQGPWNIGLLAVNQDSADGIDQDVDLLVGRIAYNLAADSTLGLMATHGAPAAGEQNSLIGLDYNYRNSAVFGDKIVEGRLWAQQTSTPQLADRDLAFGGELQFPNDRLHAFLRLQEFQENFNPALGFVNRRGIRNHEAFFRFRHRPSTGPWRALNHWVYGNWIDEANGELATRFLDLTWLELVSHPGDVIGLRTLLQYELITQPFEVVNGLTIEPGVYKFTGHQLSLSSAPQRLFSVRLVLGGGEFFDGTNLHTDVGLDWRPSSKFSFGVDLIRNDIDLPEGRFIARIHRLRADLAFNSRWSWLNLVQFDNVSNRLGINSRLRFIPRAGQEIFFVLNQGQVRDSARHSSFMTELSELTIKALYTFRF